MLLRVFIIFFSLFTFRTDLLPDAYVGEHLNDYFDIDSCRFFHPRVGFRSEKKNIFSSINFQVEIVVVTPGRFPFNFGKRVIMRNPFMLFGYSCSTKTAHFRSFLQYCPLTKIQIGFRSLKPQLCCEIDCGRLHKKNRRLLGIFLFSY